MLIKSSLGRQRAVAGGVAKHRPPVLISRRPLHLTSRPSCTSAGSNTVRIMRLIAARRGVRTFTRSAIQSSSVSHALKNWTRKVVATLRSTKIQYTRLNRLFARLSVPVFHSKNSTTLASQILRGALSAFKTVDNSASAALGRRAAYARLGSPYVTFARGASSGLGARPAFGSLVVSPLRGGVGLQPARKFSSGGARIFDNLMVNAPLALRLAGDEAEQKAKLLARPTLRGSRRVTPCGQGKSGGSATVSTASWSRNPLLLPTSHKARKPAAASVATTEAILEEVDGSRFSAAQKQKAIEADLATYFELPALCLPCDAAPVTTLTIRLVDPLYEALGGRDPLPFDISRGRVGATLLDAPLKLDVCTIVEREHARYMQAKALLRVLWDYELLGSHGSMDLFSDPEQWHVQLGGTTPLAVRQILDAHLSFDYRAWVSFGGGGGGQDLAPPSARSSATTPSPSHPTTSDATTTTTGFILDASPPFSTSSSLSSHDPDNDSISEYLFDGPPSSPSESSLYDSRDFL